MSSGPLALVLTLAAVAGVWLLLCSACAVGVFLGMAALHCRVLRADQAAAQAEGKAAS